VLCYALCGLAFVPVTLLIAGTALAFGAWQALLYAMLGSLSSASLCYGLGRALHPLPLRYLRGARMMKLRVQLRRRGFRGVIAARLVPVGNFTAVNLLAGALRVPFRTFMLANFFGLLPGVLVLTLLADRLKHGLREPTALNLALLLLAATATGFCVQWLRRAFRRSAPASSALSEAAHGGPAE
jgi:uncharacterized membrane protein YdjX (TVP38/TMEM64 family)